MDNHPDAHRTTPFRFKQTIRLAEMMIDVCIHSIDCPWVHDMLRVPIGKIPEEWSLSSEAHRTIRDVCNATLSAVKARTENRGQTEQTLETLVKIKQSPSETRSGTSEQLDTHAIRDDMTRLIAGIKYVHAASDQEQALSPANNAMYTKYSVEYLERVMELLCLNAHYVQYFAIVNIAQESDMRQERPHHMYNSILDGKGTAEERLTAIREVESMAATSGKKWAAHHIQLNASIKEYTTENWKEAIERVTRGVSLDGVCSHVFDRIASIMHTRWYDWIVRVWVPAQIGLIPYENTPYLEHWQNYTMFILRFLEGLWNWSHKMQVDVLRYPDAMTWNVTSFKAWMKKMEELDNSSTAHWQLASWHESLETQVEHLLTFYMHGIAARSCDVMSDTIESRIQLYRRNCHVLKICRRELVDLLYIRATPVIREAYVVLRGWLEKKAPMPDEEQLSWQQDHNVVGDTHLQELLRTPLIQLMEIVSTRTIHRQQPDSKVHIDVVSQANWNNDGVIPDLRRAIAAGRLLEVALPMLEQMFRATLDIQVEQNEIHWKGLVKTTMETLTNTLGSRDGQLGWYSSLLTMFGDNTNIWESVVSFGGISCCDWIIMWCVPRTNALLEHVNQLELTCEQRESQRRQEVTEKVAQAIEARRVAEAVEQAMNVEVERRHLNAEELLKAEAAAKSAEVKGSKKKKNKKKDPTVDSPPASPAPPPPTVSTPSATSETAPDSNAVLLAAEAEETRQLVELSARCEAAAADAARGVAKEEAVEQVARSAVAENDARVAEAEAAVQEAESSAAASILQCAKESAAKEAAEAKVARTNADALRVHANAEGREGMHEAMTFTDPGVATAVAEARLVAEEAQTREMSHTPPPTEPTAPPKVSNALGLWIDTQLTLLEVGLQVVIQIRSELWELLQESLDTIENEPTLMVQEEVDVIDRMRKHLERLGGESTDENDKRWRTIKSEIDRTYAMLTETQRQTNKLQAYIPDAQRFHLYGSIHEFHALMSVLDDCIGRVAAGNETKPRSDSALALDQLRKMRAALQLKRRQIDALKVRLDLNTQVVSRATVALRRKLATFWTPEAPPPLPTPLPSHLSERDSGDDSDESRPGMSYS